MEIHRYKPEPMPLRICSQCLYKKLPNGGWCYMFRDEPKGNYCLQFRAYVARSDGDKGE